MPPCSSGQYPARGGDRPCLVPTGLSRRIGGAAHTRQGSRDPRRPVGVRQRLTRPAVRGRQTTGVRRAVGRDQRRMPGGDPHLPRLRRGGRGSASPLQRGQTIPGRAVVSGVGALAPCCRDQAVPDPPAREGWQIDAKGCGGAWCLDHGYRGGQQRTPGAEAPGSVRKPPEGGCAAHSGSGRSAGCRRRVDQPASAGLGTEPGRSRPGDRGEGRSADLRCVSCETCRPR
jgi:hypothetical protein